MKILITGMTGFIGRYLAEFLVAKGHNVTGTIFPEDNRHAMPPSLKDVATNLVDMRDRPMVEGLVESVQPDVVYHLAGQAYVIPSYRDAELTYKVNLLGTLYLLESGRRYCPEASVGVACSGAAYGMPRTLPVREDHPLQPVSPYAVSKAAQDMMCFQYHENFGLRTYRLRLFETTGPGKIGDAPNDFASQLANAESNHEAFVKVGNLSTSRDISDVRDVIRAMQTVVERGEPGEAYNIGSGSPMSIKEVLNSLLALSTAKVTIVNDKDRMRPSDEPVLYADVSKIRKLGWNPQISIDKTLGDVMDYWRNNTGSVVSMVTAP